MLSREGDILSNCLSQEMPLHPSSASHRLDLEEGPVLPSSWRCLHAVQLTHDHSVSTVRNPAHVLFATMAVGALWKTNKCLFLISEKEKTRGYFHTWGLSFCCQKCFLFCKKINDFKHSSFLCSCYADKGGFVNCECICLCKNWKVQIGI